jgi:NAD(P)-dependent dehydrogenase (short-subunit alcohol dehydrogenase family)
MNKIFDLSKKNIIVTGSNRGNGLAISKGLIKAGAKVIRIDKKFNTNLNSDDYQFDLSKISEIPNLVLMLSKKYKKIFGLVNNAGITVATDNPYKDFKAYEETLNVNLHSVFVLSSEICPIMAKNKDGSIINITSLGAHLGFEGNPSYQISKSGVRQLTKSLARDWGKNGIRVNNICPGYIKTSMTSKSFNNKKEKKKREDRMILNRWGSPTDLVGPAIFLLSNASSYITGTDIVVDGGWIANGM